MSTATSFAAQQNARGSLTRRPRSTALAHSQASCAWSCESVRITRTRRPCDGQIEDLNGRFPVVDLRLDGHRVAVADWVVTALDLGEAARHDGRRTGAS